jgi:hypothetical protein
MNGIKKRHSIWFIICGVVDFPLWDAIEVVYFAHPALHVEIGLANHALVGFDDVADENIEVVSFAEKITCYAAILAHTA